MEEDSEKDHRERVPNEEIIRLFTWKKIVPFIFGARSALVLCYLYFKAS